MEYSNALNWVGSFFTFYSLLGAFFNRFISSSSFDPGDSAFGLYLSRANDLLRLGLEVFLMTFNVSALMIWDYTGWNDYEGMVEYWSICVITFFWELLGSTIILLS
jgi:hypothetical protein